MEQNDTRIYTALINDEGQYSIWLRDKPIPNGWRDAQKTGLKQEVLDFIEAAWTDIRPVSVRKQLAQDAD
jgi:MbtH protein